MKIRKAAALTALALSACSMATTDEELVARNSQAAESHNRIVLNRIVLNSLAVSSLSSTQIASGTLVDGTTMVFNSTYDPSAPPGTLIHETAEGRDVLEYIVRCALGPDTTVTADHQGQTYVFTGGLGLAEAWVTRALTAIEASILSACLYAHVNHFGVSVPISIRFPGFGTWADSAEAADYPVLEGAFMGTYFVDTNETMELYACQGDSYEVASANSDNRDERVCTDVESDSGFTVVGRCREVCEGYEPGNGWFDCWANGVQYAQVANVFLHTDDPNGANATCPTDGTCLGANRLDSGDDKSAVLTGNGADDVEARCGQDSVCIINGVAAGALTVTVDDNAIAEVNCAGAAQCAVDADTGASVEINCRDTATCNNIICPSGASCLLQCGTSASCGFALCDAGVVSCSNGALACNADCL